MTASIKGSAALAASLTILMYAAPSSARHRIYSASDKVWNAECGACHTRAESGDYSRQTRRVPQ